MFSRDRLKEFQALGLDDAGKEKAVLVDMLMGGKVTPALSSPPPRASATTNLVGNPNVKNCGATRVSVLPDKVDLPSSDHLTIDCLEGYLWSAADILRGSIDSSDYKNFIFGLLFLKRLSDRDEECAALVAGGHDPKDVDGHDFFVPKRARWSEIQKVATNIGETLQQGVRGKPSAPALCAGDLRARDPGGTDRPTLCVSTMCPRTATST